jgi:hypothetical protein
MKPFIILSLVLAFTAMSCEKPDYKNTGTITGQDVTLCACCGGYFIDINGTQYRFDKSTLPGNFTFEDKQLPLNVELDWELRTEMCKDFNWINITKIRKQ